MKPQRALEVRCADFHGASPERALAQPRPIGYLCPMQPAPYCLCAPVTEKALENVRANGGAGAYKDTHPWYLARELLAEARSRGETLPILFASGLPEEFGWWAEVEDIDVEAFHVGTWETRCGFRGLRPVADIFRPLDSIALYPGNEQLRREAIEPIAQHRQYLTPRLLRPYAIAETPPYVGMAEAESRPPRTV